MSEDLTQTTPEKLGKYEYYRLGSTTLKALKKHKFYRGPLKKEDELRKPDGIIYYPGVGIKAVIEVKQPSELTRGTLPRWVKKYSPIAAAVCNVLIITDGNKSYWYNPHTESPIITTDGTKLREVFNPKPLAFDNMPQEKVLELNDLFDQADQMLSKANNQLIKAKIIDPTPLAETVWQKIWITTGKEPEKCLYNVVEIFVFKFLSDIGVLKGIESFPQVLSLKDNDDENAPLNYYAKIVRPKIIELFPKGDDKTTIINGTIFVNEEGLPNKTMSSLFNSVLTDFKDFDRKNGSMRHIDREFKTRLFETFLRQSAGVKSLGQYFTPRNVVRSMVRMSNADKLPDNARICDPFCGVGGFVLETIAEYPKIMKMFEPVNGKVSPAFTIRGYDKGSDEKDDERTIILAKANMLIYLSDLLSKYHNENYLKEFSIGAFNSVFHLIRDNLGTFAKVHDAPYDLILTNPPYVTSGSKTLRENIISRNLGDYYENTGRGTEALAIQWIINHLKPEGKAFVVVPDGLMNQESILTYIKDKCFIRTVIALPSRTFFSTPKKTYILEIEKKKNIMESQSDAVFCYIISEIGETRDARRLPIKENDLIKAEKIHRYFSILHDPQLPALLEDPRAAAIPWQEFDALDTWLIERLWTPDERKALGIDESNIELDEEGFYSLIQEIMQDLNNFLGVIDEN